MNGVSIMKDSTKRNDVENSKTANLSQTVLGIIFNLPSSISALYNKLVY